jgi:hypothetical protein
MDQAAFGPDSLAGYPFAAEALDAFLPDHGRSEVARRIKAPCK